MEARNASSAGTMQTAIDLALFDAFAAAKKWEDALTVALRLSAASPMSKTAFMALAISQMQTRRWKECEQSANDLLKALPSDPDAMRMIQGVAER